MKKMLILLAITLSIFLTSCGRNFVGKSQPIFFDIGPCYRLEEQDIQYHHFLALLYSFKARKWMLKTIDQEKFIIIAEACRGRYCLEVIAKVDKKGKVQISRTTDDKISRSGANLLKRWLRLLKTPYFNSRCNSLKSLKEKAFGF